MSAVQSNVSSDTSRDFGSRPFAGFLEDDRKVPPAITLSFVVFASGGLWMLIFKAVRFALNAID